MLRHSDQNASMFQSKRRGVFKKGRDVFKKGRGELFFTAVCPNFTVKSSCPPSQKNQGVKILVILVSNRLTYSLSTTSHDT